MDSFEMPTSAFVGSGMQRKKMETLQKRVEAPSDNSTVETVRVAIELSDIKKIITLSKDCVNDLSYELDQRYSLRDKYPSELRKYNNEMDYINNLRECIEKIKDQLT